METVPFKVLHTDVTQVRLADTKWAYVSAITDEASKEVLAFQVSNSPNSKLIMDTLDELTENIPEGIKPMVLLQSLKIKYKVYNPSCS
ncbi:DDE-type integrase/transposase/recombinase [Lactococcus lactis]|uniref:DDE-type integrase/transposase/recombinase n=1 Tax=Lactococcus lactis TaxID=1358 RepID=UPI00117BD1B3